MYPPCFPFAVLYSGAPLSSTGSRRVRFPRFLGTIRALRLLTMSFPSLRFPSLRIPSGDCSFRFMALPISVRLQSSRTARTHLYPASKPFAAPSQWELVSSPRFLGNPFVHLPCSSTPPEPPLRPSKVWCCSRYHYDESFRNYLTFEAQLHGFCTRCLRFALRSPYMRKTRFRSAANRFRPGLSPVGLLKRVSMCYMSPPSRLCLAPSNYQYDVGMLIIGSGRAASQPPLNDDIFIANRRI